jgi:predicted ATPase/tetratricopeptide (TPR) repeat protein
MGGLLVKQILINAGNSKTFGGFLENTKGVVFLDTPHGGSGVARFWKALGIKAPRSTVAVEELSKDNRYLDHLNSQYRNKAHDLGIGTLVYVAAKPVRYFGFVSIRLVERWLSNPGLPNVTPIHVDEDHSTISKPMSRDSQVYSGVKRFILDVLQVVPLDTQQSNDGQDHPPSSKLPVRDTISPDTTTSTHIAKNDLPTQLTPFIGREVQVEEIRGMLLSEDIRLLTLTGAGGSGKTRLSLQVASTLLENFKDGVWFVELASLTDHSLMLSTIARTLGVRESEKPLSDILKEYLHRKDILLVLDNFEQILEAAPEIVDLLQAAPHLKMIVTSRASLAVTGEQQYPVPPLAVPDTEKPLQLEKLSQVEAIRLFIQSARRVKSAFSLNEENAIAVAEICARLDGLPLALELAAARLNILSPQMILEKLSERLKLLVGGARDLPMRQQTLRATIDWSYHLLNAEEKLLFRQMAIFQGGFSLEALQAVCHVNGVLKMDLLNEVTALVRWNLLQQRQDRVGQVRFWALETIHEYAREKLLESGEIATIRRRHIRYYHSLVKEGYPQIWNPVDVKWLNLLEEEQDNLRAALRWAVEPADRATRHRFSSAMSRGIEIRLGMAARLSVFWRIRGYINESREQLRSSLKMIDEKGTAFWSTLSKEGQWSYSAALYEAGKSALAQGDLREAQTFIEKCLAIGKKLRDKENTIIRLISLGDIARTEGNYSRARALFEESLATSRKLKLKHPIALALSSLGEVDYLEGNCVEARTLFEESLMLWQELGERANRAAVLYDLGVMSTEQGDYERGRSLMQESLLILVEIGDRGRIPASFAGLAEVSLHRPSGGRRDLRGAERAAKLLGASEALHEVAGTIHHSFEHRVYARTVANTRRILSDAKWEAAFQEGRAMSMEEAITYALEES